MKKNLSIIVLLILCIGLIVYAINQKNQVAELESEIRNRDAAVEMATIIVQRQAKRADSLARLAEKKLIESEIQSLEDSKKKK